VEVICPTAQAEYFCEGGLDRPNQLEMVGEIRVQAHLFWLVRAMLPGRIAIRDH
jgi:hypothetical protein